MTITCIEYDGRITLKIRGPAKMQSYMTASREFAHLMGIALESLSERLSDTHRLDRNDMSGAWQYTAYYGD